jgi:integrase
VLRRAFDFGYRDRPLQENPARCLRSARILKIDRPKIDPFCMHDAETLIAAIHRDWGEAQGNYDEFRFFTVLRPSEEIALVLSDLDLVSGLISVNKARVSGVDRCKTKTGDDRRVQLCPRALAVLRRHLRLRARLAAAGKIDHDHVFFLDSGAPIQNLQCPQIRWRKTLQSLKLRYRRPYTARHSSVSWNLMVGKNVLWVAKQHGHSIVTMLRIYAAWAEGAVEADVEAIKRSMNLTWIRRGSLALKNLAVDLPVAEDTDDLGAFAFAVPGVPSQALSTCFDTRKTAKNWIISYGWGGRIIRPWRASPLRGRPRRVKWKAASHPRPMISKWSHSICPTTNSITGPCRSAVSSYGPCSLSPAKPGLRPATTQSQN